MMPSDVPRIVLEIRGFSTLSMGPSKFRGFWSEPGRANVPKQWQNFLLTQTDGGWGNF